MLTLRLPFRVATQTRLAPLITKSLLARRVILPIRSYATPAKPKKGSIGETAKRGRTTKAAPKAAAKKPAANKPAAKKPAAKRTAAKKTVTTKAAKKTTAPKTPTKAALAKAATKKRAAERAVKAKAKKRELLEKKRVRAKAQREREVAKKAAKKAAEREAAKKKAEKAKAKAAASDPKTKIKLLKTQALDAPAEAGSASAWIEFWRASLKQGSATVGKNGLGAAVKAAKEEFAQLSPSQKESYTRAAQEHKAQRAKEYAAWINGHSAEEIRVANTARTTLRSLKVRGYSPLKDDRQLKKPMSAYLRFHAERFRSGQHSNIPTEAAKESGEAWKAMSESQKKDYVDAYSRELLQYFKQYETQYGHPPPGAARKAASA